MIKVCHMTSVHDSQDVRILKKQCTSLAAAGYDTFLVAKGQSYTESGVRVVGIGAVTGGRIKRMTQVTKRIYQTALSLDCDIYQIHDPELLPYAIKLKQKGKKVIFDSHENYVMQMQEKYYIPKIARKLISGFYERYQNYVLGRLDGVIFPCLKDGKDIFAEKCANSAIIGNQAKLEEFYAHYNENVRKIERSACHVGALTYSRGIRHLIEAANLAEAKLILGGKLSPIPFAEEVANLPQFSNVEHRGFCSRDQVLDIYAESRIGVCTILNVGQYNQYDNFATKVYEFMSMGLPVILARSAYAEKVNAQYNFAILVDPANVEEIANAMAYLFAHPEIAKQMGANGRRAVKEECNWGVEEKKLLMLYEKISAEIKWRI